MTATTYRLIETAFEREARRPGGKSVSEALLEAHSNLTNMGPKTMPRFYEGLQTIRQGIGNGQDRPTDATLNDIYGVADKLIGYCLTVNRPGLDQILHRTARLSDAIRHSDLWIPGTFAPLVEMFQLTLDGSLGLAQVSTLVSNIDLCIDRYERTKTNVVLI
mgnify:FL=1